MSLDLIGATPATIPGVIWRGLYQNRLIIASADMNRNTTHHAASALTGLSQCFDKQFRLTTTDFTGNATELFNNEWCGIRKYRSVCSRTGFQPWSEKLSSIGVVSPYGGTIICCHEHTLGQSVFMTLVSGNENALRNIHWASFRARLGVNFAADQLYNRSGNERGFYVCLSPARQPPIRHSLPEPCSAVSAFCAIYIQQSAAWLAKRYCSLLLPSPFLLSLRRLISVFQTTLAYYLSWPRCSLRTPLKRRTKTNQDSAA